MCNSNGWSRRVRMLAGRASDGRLKRLNPSLARFEVGNFALAPKVRQQDSPGQSGAVLRAAPPWVGSCSPSASPERAKQPATVAPFQGSGELGSLDPGRRCAEYRFALPWADLLRPLRGKINAQLQNLRVQLTPERRFAAPITRTPILQRPERQCRSKRRKTHISGVPAYNQEGFKSFPYSITESGRCH